MKRSHPFAPEQNRALADALRRGAELLCPECEAPLDEWPVPPREDVSYVRNRVWLVCASCARSTVLDRQDA